MVEYEKRSGVKDALTYTQAVRGDGSRGVVDLPLPSVGSARAVALVRPYDLRIWTEHAMHIDKTGTEWKNLQQPFHNEALFAMPSTEMWEKHHDVMSTGMSKNLEQLPTVFAQYTDLLTQDWKTDQVIDHSGKELGDLFLEINMLSTADAVLGCPLDHETLLWLRAAMAKLHAGADIQLNEIWSPDKQGQMANETTADGLRQLHSYASLVRSTAEQYPGRSPVVDEFIAREQEYDFGERKTRHEIITIILGSQATLSPAQLSLLHFLSKQENTTIQGKLRNVYDAERETLLRAAFKESLRLFPPMYVQSRDATEDFSFQDSSGQHISLTEGNKVVIFPSVTHRLPDIWENPEVFDPTRHIRGTARKQRPPRSFIPFGFGSHVCVGAPLSIAAGPTPVMKILEMYEVSLKQEVNPNPEYNFTLSPNKENIYSFIPIH